MAYYQAVVYGDTYSYIFPVSGRLNKNMLSEDNTRSGANVYAFHGKRDSVISFNGGQNAVNMLLKRDINVNFFSFDGGHHGIFREMKSKISQMVGEKLESIR